MNAAIVDQVGPVDHMNEYGKDRKKKSYTPVDWSIIGAWSNIAVRTKDIFFCLAHINQSFHRCTLIAGTYKAIFHLS